MAQRALNKAQLIGNLTRDPELRYTPSGTAVCTFGLATNRSWVTDTGEKRDDVEFHRLVAWSKLAEICSQLLFKGRRVYIEGRLQTRQWTGKDGVSRQTTEVVVSDMIVLDSKRNPQETDDSDQFEPSGEYESLAEDEGNAAEPKTSRKAGSKGKVSSKTASAATKKTAAKAMKEKASKGTKKSGKSKKGTAKEKEVKVEDIPF